MERGGERGYLHFGTELVGDKINMCTTVDTDTITSDDAGHRGASD